MKIIKQSTKAHRFYTVSARLNYYEMLKLRKLQKKSGLTSSELLRKLIAKEIKDNMEHSIKGGKLFT